MQNQIQTDRFRFLHIDLKLRGSPLPLF